MPVFQKLVDNDKTYRELTKPPIIINDLHNQTSEDRDYIQRLIMTTYSSDMVSVLPSCKCGATKGEFAKNMICKSCQTPVTATMEDTIQPLVWFRKPEGVYKLMAPILWIMLEHRFSKGKFSVLRWLTDTSYAPQSLRPVFVDKIEEAGIQRGYNYFIQNFFPIVSFLLELKEFKIKKNTPDYLMTFLQENKNVLFSDYLPLMNKSLLIVEQTSFATYIDSTVPMAIDAIEMLVSIDKDFYDQTPTVKQNRTARALYILGCRFFDMYFKKIVAKKAGLFRHYLGGSRFDYSARAVISSRTNEHRYDELEIPWGVGLTIFRPMMINKLIKKSHMLINDAVSLLLSHIGVYHPVLDQYLQEIISEHKEGRYPVIFNRFPSLLQGSIQKMYISKVKTDPKDLTLGISILAVTAPNADKTQHLFC